MVSRTESEKEDVLSGVPQGMVLAWTPFNDIISDIDENIKQATANGFGDKKKVIKVMNIEKKGKKLIQQYVNIMYKWTEENVMNVSRV